LAARTLRQRAQIAMALGDYKRAADDFREGYFLARSNHDTEVAASSAAGMAIAALDLSHDSEASDWSRLADVEATLSGAPESELEALGALATVQRARTEADNALASAERFLALARRLDTQVVVALRSRAAALGLLGRYDAALADLDAAIAILTKRYGEHPEVAAIEGERALVLAHLRRSSDAITAARHGVQIAESTTGPDSVAVNNALAALGVALKDAKQYDEALATLTRSLALTRRNDGPRAYNTASDLNNEADLLHTMGRIEDALAAWKESREIFVEVVGPDGNEVGIVDGNIANALFDAHRIGEAFEPAARALKVMARTPDSPIYGQALIAVGMTQAERHEWAAAKQALTDGLAKLDADPRWQARAHFTLAQIELANGRPASARTLATTARDEARAADEPDYTREIENLLRRLNQ
jgi:tetratricopeptide (TPR) repeat protein